MKKKKVMEKILCAAIIAMMVVAFTPTVTAGIAPPGEADCWVVTDDVITKTAKTHNFYDEHAHLLEDTHDQEWYTDYQTIGQQPVPIRDKGWYIDTTMECSTECSNNQTILRVGTVDKALKYETETIYWTVINGNVTGARFIVNVTWKDDKSKTHSNEVNLTIDGDTEDFNLGYLQELEMALIYFDGSTSPGQKDYWIETDLGEGPVDKSEQWHNWTDDYEDSQDDFTETGSPHNLTWWTDYYGFNQTIESAGGGFQINTKALVSAEVVGNAMILHVTVYGQSNYNPEIIKWTVDNGATEYDPFFVVDIASDDIPQDWTSINLYDGSSEFEEIGSLDNLTLSLHYYDGDGE